MTSDIYNALVAGALPGIALAMISVMASLRREKAARKNGRRVLDYNVFAKIVAILSLLIFCYLVVLAFYIILYGKNEILETPWLALLCFILLLALTVLFFAIQREVLLKSISYDSNNIYIDDWIRGLKTLKTMEIDTVDFKSTSSYLILYSNSSSIKIWGLRNGVGELAEFLSISKAHTAAPSE